jgi:hypothetical protein
VLYSCTNTLGAPHGQGAQMASTHNGRRGCHHETAVDYACIMFTCVSLFPVVYTSLYHSVVKHRLTGKSLIEAVRRASCWDIETPVPFTSLSISHSVTQTHCVVHTTHHRRHSHHSIHFIRSLHTCNPFFSLLQPCLFSPLLLSFSLPAPPLSLFLRLLSLVVFLHQCHHRISDSDR